MNIEKIFNNKGLIYDRHLFSEINLPYSFNDIKIQANETVSNEILNLKFNHIYDNFLYLYKNSIIASNIIPVSSTAMAGVTSNAEEFTWYTNISTSQFVYITAYPDINNISDMIVIKNQDINQYTAFVTSGSAIRALNFDKNASYITSSYFLDVVVPTFNVKFSQITDFAQTSTFLFVLDKGLNRLIKYDASGFTTNEITKRNKLYFMDSIGNFGKFNSKTEFNNPHAVSIYNNEIYLLDSGNSSVKKYDINLNWIQTYRLYQDFLNDYPIDIASDKTGNLYILTNTNKIFLYNNNVSNLKIINLAKLNENETFKKIVFSKSNDNVFYLYSEKNIYKKFVTSSDQIVGKYLFYLYKYDILSEKIGALGSANTDIGDINLVASTSGNTIGKMSYFFDNLNLFDVLAERKFDVYDALDITFNKDEYLQNWVINKNISKTIINHMRLRDQIVGKFIALRDSRDNIVFDGTRYLLPTELESIYFGQDIDYYIGVNEIVCSSVLNRSLEKIFNIQQQLLDALKADILSAPNVSTIITLN